MTRLISTLAGWGCWDSGWSIPATGGITQARQRLGHEPVKELFHRVGRPVAELLTPPSRRSVCAADRPQAALLVPTFNRKVVVMRPGKLREATAWAASATEHN